MFRSSHSLVLYSLGYSILTSMFLWWKRKSSGLLIIFLISLLPLYSMLRPGSYEAGDLSLHTIKLMEFYKSLQEGVFPPQWAGNLNANYGYTLFIFTYWTPYYIAAVFKFLGFGFLASMKLALASTYVISGLAMYLWGKDEFKSKMAGFSAAIFYLFAPYYLVDLHFRNPAGEIVAFAFLPIILLAIRRKRWLSTAFTFWLLILSHQIIAVASMPVILWYAWRTAPKQILALVLGGLLASHYWIPHLFESRYILESVIYNPIYFPKFLEFFYAPWRWGFLFQGPEAHTTVMIGYIHWIIISAATWWAIKKKDKRLKELLIIFLIYFLMMQGFSTPMWNVIPLMKHFQFSFRLLVVVALIIAMISSKIFSKIKPHVAIIILFITVGTTILNWGNRRNIPEINDEYLSTQIPYLVDGISAATVWMTSSNIWMDTIPTSPISGKVKYEQIFKNSVTHEYKVYADKPTKIIENTTYFPGWTAWIDEKSIPVRNRDGKIALDIPKGEHVLKLKFLNTPVRQLSMYFSLILVLISVYFSGRCRTRTCDLCNVNAPL